MTMNEQNVEKHGLSNTRRQFATFHLGTRLFGVDILDVKEITPETSLTNIFHAAPEVKGYVNIRGQVHLVLDLRTLLGLDQHEVDKKSRVVLFKSDVGDDFGVLVDQISDIVTVDDHAIEDRRHNEGELLDKADRRVADLGLGVCKLDSGLLVLLNSHRFLQGVEA